MRIDDLSTLITTVASPRVTSVLNTWRAGQIIEAIVARVSNVGTATLNVNNTPIDVRTTLPLEVGARLLLEVAQMGRQPTLRIVTAPAVAETVAHAIRSLAPQQGSLKPVLEQLVRWAGTEPTTSTPRNSPLAPAPASPPGTAPSVFPLPAAPPPMALRPTNAPPPAPWPAPIPPPLRELAQRVLERIATPQQIATPDGLKQAIKDSGVFFEHKLASPAARPETTAPPAQDLKAVLLQLASVLKTALPPTAPVAAPSPNANPSPAPTAPRNQQPAPAQQAAAIIDAGLQLQVLAKETDAAVARVTLQQLLSLPEKTTDAPQWIFDLPVRWGESINIIHLHIYREKHPRDPKHPPAWCVRLSFDLLALGEIGVLVTLLGGAVSLSIWALQPATKTLFDQHIGELQAQLRDAGVPVNRISCECGAAPFTADTPLAQKQRYLIDEKA